MTLPNLKKWHYHLHTRQTGSLVASLLLRPPTPFSRPSPSHLWNSTSTAQLSPTASPAGLTRYQSGSLHSVLQSALLRFKWLPHAPRSSTDSLPRWQEPLPFSSPATPFPLWTNIQFFKWDVVSLLWAFSPLPLPWANSSLCVMSDLHPHSLQEALQDSVLNQGPLPCAPWTLCLEHRNCPVHQRSPRIQQSLAHSGYPSICIPEECFQHTLPQIIKYICGFQFSLDQNDSYLQIW